MSNVIKGWRFDLPQADRHVEKEASITILAALERGMGLLAHGDVLKRTQYPQLAWIVHYDVRHHP